VKRSHHSKVTDTTIARYSSRETTHIHTPPFLRTQNLRMAFVSTGAMKYPYRVDYNDHFETPIVAYEHILPLLDAVQKPLKNSKTSTSSSAGRHNHIIYDPYYCNGRTKQLMQSFGFENVVHEKRDFYLDIEKNQVPRHDTFVTNPPYSTDHKERCVRYAVDQLRTDEERAFFILMPNYVAVRNHFRASILANNGSENETDDPRDILYVVPPTPYEYEHPEGTGKDFPPFASIWFCGIPSGKVDAAKQMFRNVHGEHSVGISHLGDAQSSNSPRLVSTLQELRALGAVPTLKRKNLKQRLKAKRQSASIPVPYKPTDADAKVHAPKKSGQHDQLRKEKEVEADQTRKKKSRHRDETGARKKKRF
jgi:hypothetical protein